MLENLGYPEKLGMEETWTSEYTGKLGEWRRRCANKLTRTRKQSGGEVEKKSGF